jgi:hypothetical protein
MRRAVSEWLWRPGRLGQTAEALLAHLVEHLGSGRIVASDNHRGTEYVRGAGARRIRGGTTRQQARPRALIGWMMNEPAPR